MLSASVWRRITKQNDPRTERIEAKSKALLGASIDSKIDSIY